MKAFIGVGSNLGDPVENIEKAKALLLQTGKINFIKVSSFYETEPWGIKEQPKFINAVWHIDTPLSPIELFLLLKEVERLMGRKKMLRYGPRIVDLDILFYEELIYQDSNITIPHPKIGERSFVLYPLAEIAPCYVHPLLSISVAVLKERLVDHLNIKLLS